MIAMATMFIHCHMVLSNFMSTHVVSSVAYYLNVIGSSRSNKKRNIVKLEFILFYTMSEITL